ncbi:hypothetical protein ABZR86_02030 [Dyella marensis]|nr:MULTISPECIES: hypothetical protein [Dyella]
MSVQSSWRTFDIDWADGGGLSARSTRDSEYFADREQYLSVLKRERRRFMLAEDKDENDETDDTVSNTGQVALLAKQASAILKKVKHRKPKKWKHQHFQVAPRIRRDVDAIAALGFAKLAAPEEAILMLYATEDVPRYWPVVKRCGLRGNTSSAHIHAITDAMQAILFGNAELAQDRRAKALHMRASAYRAILADYLSLLWIWIRRAADAYSRSLTGLSIGQVRAAMDRMAGQAYGDTAANLAIAPLQTTVNNNTDPANEAGLRGVGR